MKSRLITSCFDFKGPILRPSNNYKTFENSTSLKNIEIKELKFRASKTSQVPRRLSPSLLQSSTSRSNLVRHLINNFQLKFPATRIPAPFRAKFPYCARARINIVHDVGTSTHTHTFTTVQRRGSARPRDKLDKSARLMHRSWNS